MKLINSKSYAYIGVAAALMAGGAMAEPTHGISFSGSLDLPAEFTNLPYVNPDAPKGGRIVYAELGSYDSFSPFIVAGKTPYGFRAHIFESLMKRSIDESFSLYCLICETVDLNDERTEMTFTLRPEAAFSNGDPVTVDDVIWSFNTLAAEGTPRYARYMNGVTMEKVGDNGLKFTMGGENRELPMLISLMPVMRAADWEGKVFSEGSIEPTLGSGAYVVDDFDMGERITFKRNPDYWGKDLPINRGLDNLDEISYEYFADSDAMFEAMKAGDVNIFVEGDPKRWDSYDFAAFNDGDVVKNVITHQRPAGVDGFYMNTRRAPLDDWRVREALITGFNFPFVNKTINDGAFARIDSFFTNSYLAGGHDAATGQLAEVLASYEGDIPADAISGYTLPAGSESGRDRDGVAHALELLAEAGYAIDDGVMRDADGNALEISVMVKSPDEERLASLWADGLRPMGITLTIDNADANTHADRLKRFDFDVVRSIRGLSLSPGAEQASYWGSAAADQEGSRNWAGLKSPAVDAIIDAMVGSEDLENYTANVQALDRVLLSERLVVPFWFNPDFRVLTAKELKFPEYTPKYGYWPGFAPEAMYWEE